MRLWPWRADEEPPHSEKLIRLRRLLKPPARVLDYGSKKVYSIERFKRRLRKSA